ncbi:MAG: ParA family protein [Chitinispirillaceae bacterium]|jgi:cellulose biosynthesis protein BcsQ
MSTKAIRFTLYNHKGGVGKTTLAVNIGAALAKQNNRVLLVDSDPQCNLTSYFYPDDFVNDLLNNSESKNGRTVWTALKNFVDDGMQINNVDPSETVVNNLFVLPGDIRLSDFEQNLADYWTDCFKRRTVGLKATCALSILVNDMIAKHKLDYVIYDTGPNIGPLNRSILLDCDYFIVPVACDLFSVRALTTLGQSLKAWILDWKTITELAPDNSYLLKGKPAFLGYIPQRFKTYGRVMARTPAFYLGHLQKKMHSDLISVLKEVDQSLISSSTTNAKLGQVKDFGSIVQIAQQEGVPFSMVEAGPQYLKDEALIAFDEIAQNIINLTKPKIRFKRTAIE